jgi:hypothetical protein
MGQIFNIQIDPSESMLMSILLEQEKEIDELKDKVKEVKE